MSDSREDGLRWCRRFHPAPTASHRLVCFPHAGGSAGFYRPVSAALSPRVDVVAVQYPGRLDRRAEPCIEDLGELADRIHRVLRPWADRPMTFFGHSMGAVVAFEVARRFERDGDGPGHLYASGRRAPSCLRQSEDPVHLRDDQAVLAEIRAMNGTAPELFASDDLLSLALPALRADYRAVETYRCEPGAVLRCPVTALVGDSDPKTSVEEARAWQRHTTGPFDLRVFPGGHFYLSDRSDEVLRVLTDHLAGVAPRHGS